MRFKSLLRSAPRRLIALGMAASIAFGGAGAATALAAPAHSTLPTCVRTDVKCVIAFGDQRIDERTAALTKLNDRASEQVAAGHITSSQASAIQADVTSNQSGLTALKGKLDAETDATAARQDVKNIYTQFRIFAVVLPRDYHEIVLDIMTNVQAKLVGLEPKLQQAIASAPADEQAQLNSLYSDFTAKLDAASTQITNANGMVSYFTPSNFDNNLATYRTNWLNFRSAVLAGRADLRQAASDLHQMAKILKPSATPAATATPTA
ncbi:MAG TPA: hypothetical protein VJO13_21620 [Ktedonobacterales bacterium]|nr:hypothetical protein [Ktedonobacterales bacterium]